MSNEKINEILDNANTKLNGINKEFVEEIQEHFNNIVVPELKKMMNYDKNFSVVASFNSNIDFNDNNELNFTSSNVELSLKFDEKMPPDHDIFNYADEYVKRHLLQDAFNHIVEQMQN